MTQLFVYGTLKRNERLNPWLKNEQFLAERVTQESGFNMTSMYGAYPIVYSDNAGYKLRGEVWDVNELVYQNLARMEGNAGYVPYTVMLEDWDAPVIMFIQPDAGPLEEKYVHRNETEIWWSTQE